MQKELLIQYAAENFTKFGSKRVTLDELSSNLGISKKTIYKHFRSKEDLLTQSLSYLINQYHQQVNYILRDVEDPISKIIIIYKIGFEHLKYFKPSFIFGLKKYYPKANEVFDTFRNETVLVTVFGLLEEAQTLNFIRKEVNLKLFCELYFNRFEEMAFKNNSVFDDYTITELLNHFVIFNLRGITSEDYKNDYFQF